MQRLPPAATAPLQSRSQGHHREPDRAPHENHGPIRWQDNHRIHHDHRPDHPHGSDHGRDRQQDALRSLTAPTNINGLLHLAQAHLRGATQPSSRYVAAVIKQVGFLMKSPRCQPPERDQLRALARMLEHAALDFDDAAVGNAGWGLHRLRPGPDADRLVAQVARHVDHFAGRLSGKSIGSACYGLRSLGNGQAAQALSQALTRKVTASTAILNAQEIGNACFGLQTLGNGKAAQDLAQALFEKARVISRLDSTSLTQALFCIPPAPAATPLGLWVMVRLSAIDGAGLSDHEVTSLVGTLARLGLASHVTPTLSHRYERALSEQPPSSSRGSHLEREVREQILQRLAPHLHTALRFGNHLAGFEMDVLMAQPKMLNIEIDGLHHAYPTQNRADRLRDDFLRSQGMDVVRINAAEFGFDPARLAAIAIEAMDLSTETKAPVSSGFIG